MAFRNLRRHDVQASYSLLLAVASIIPCLAGAYLCVRNYQDELGRIVYGAEGRFIPAFIGSLLAAMLLSSVAFSLGWNSAGQRRNDKSRHSWIGFFVGGAILTCSFILVIAFVMLRLQTD